MMSDIVKVITSPIKFLKLKALSYAFAVEYSKIEDVFFLSNASKIAVFHKSAVMVYNGNIIPLIDYRGVERPFEDMIGACTVVTRIFSARVAIVVQQASETIYAKLSDIEKPCDSVKSKFPYCDGQLNDDGEHIHVLDIEKFLGPAISGRNSNLN